MILGILAGAVLRTVLSFLVVFVIVVLVVVPIALAFSVALMAMTATRTIAIVPAGVTLVSRGMTPSSWLFCRLVLVGASLLECSFPCTLSLCNHLAAVFWKCVARRLHLVAQWL